MMAQVASLSLFLSPTVMGHSKPKAFLLAIKSLKWDVSIGQDYVDHFARQLKLI